MAERNYKTNRGILLGQDNNALVYLIAINLLVFVFLSFIKIIYYLSELPIELFYHQIQDWFSLSGIGEKLATRPWTLISYMFTHQSIWGLISSVLWLWCFGYILQDLTGNSKLIPIYLYGGFVGGLVFVLTVNIFPVLATNLQSIEPLLGAGAALMAVAVATTTLAPGYRILPLINGGIPLWVLLVIFMAIDFTTFASSNLGIGVAHISGGAMGFFFIKQLRSGNDWSSWMIQFVDWVNDLFNPEKIQASNSNNKNQFKKSAHKTPSVTQQKLDEILDKINQQGYQFLTDEEKGFLKRASKEDLL
jgi:membrane associated rhomboid family serine protease